VSGVVPCEGKSRWNQFDGRGHGPCGVPDAAIISIQDMAQPGWNARPTGRGAQQMN
jgi:hypothetical protein